MNFLKALSVPLGESEGEGLVLCSRYTLATKGREKEKAGEMEENCLCGGFME